MLYKDALNDLVEPAVFLGRFCLVYTSSSFALLSK